MRNKKSLYESIMREVSSIAKNEIDKDNTIDEILGDLEYNKSNYDLDGVEITVEDAETALDIMNCGKSYDEAIDIVLSGIADTLDF